MRRASLAVALASAATLLVTLVVVPAATPLEESTWVPAWGTGAEASGPIVIGPADPAATVALVFPLVVRDPDGLRDASRAVDDPSSPDYRRFLTPAQIGDRYGIAAAEEAQVIERLTSAGLAVSGRVPQRSSLRASGTVAAVGQLLGVGIEVLRDPRSGASYLAADREPVIPADLQGLVAGVIGLERTLPAPAIDPADRPPLPTRGLKPIDLARAYGFTSLWDAGIRGAGTSVAILQFGVDTDEDLAVFDAEFGIAGPAPERIPVGDGISSDAPVDFESEATLDTQVVRAVAPEASILVYGTDLRGGFAAPLDQIVAEGRSQFVSISYGRCFVPESLARSEAEALNASLAQARLAGVTVFAASGDTGAFTCHMFDRADHRPTVTWPGCALDVVSVGGTYLETREDGSYLRETGWQDYLETAGSGGGISPLDARPEHQTAEVLGDDASPEGRRQCPDVSASADSDTGYFMFYTGPVDPSQPEQDVPAWRVVGGTSAAAPFWAATAALVQQRAGQEGVDRLGSLGPILYRIAATRPDAFHDVVRGGNLLQAANQGWDYATGLGSPVVDVLAEAVVEELKP
jgi:kumamolisin